MNTRLIIAALALAAGLGAAATPAPKSPPAAPGSVQALSSLPPSPLVNKMKLIRASLDEVFKIHDANNALPDLRQNPFRIPGVPADSAQAQNGPGAGRGPVRPAETDANRLRRLVSALPFGFLERAGQPAMVTINSSSYKEGDVVRVTDTVANTQVLLRIRKIADKSVTFSLNSAEFTVTK